MKFFLVTYLLINTCSSLFAQYEDRWKAYWNADKELIGFKDNHGHVMIEPRFTNFIGARYFDRIIAVAENITGTTRYYYLTKSGKIVGRDSLYIYDNAPDCESEGFIRFRDSKNDKAGMLNSLGQIVIPAEYSDLSKVRNGFVIALKDAEKIYLTEDQNSHDNHYRWTGGLTYLIDTTNRILIKNFALDESHLDFYSIKVEVDPIREKIRKYFIGTDNYYYSFIDIKREFQEWLYSVLLGHFSKGVLIDNSYGNIYFWKESDGWRHTNSSEFFDRNFNIIKNIIIDFVENKSDYYITVEGLNPFIFMTPEFETYFNNCGEPEIWKHPLLNLIINNQTGSCLYQDYFDFLRTGDGYKLISVSLGAADLD